MVNESGERFLGIIGGASRSKSGRNIRLIIKEYEAENPKSLSFKLDGEDTESLQNKISKNGIQSLVGKVGLGGEIDEDHFYLRIVEEEPTPGLIRRTFERLFGYRVTKKEKLTPEQVHGTAPIPGYYELEPPIVLAKGVFSKYLEKGKNDKRN